MGYWLISKKGLFSLEEMERPIAVDLAIIGGVLWAGNQCWIGLVKDPLCCLAYYHWGINGWFSEYLG